MLNQVQHDMKMKRVLIFDYGLWKSDAELTIIIRYYINLKLI